MISYYERYLHGEHAAVWDELSQVGEAIFTEPLYADALAVAFATMQRAQAAILQLQQRLHMLGYQFGVTHFEPVTCFWMEDEVRPPAPYTPAVADAPDKVAALEMESSRLPLSLRAWYEHIESACFVGTFVETDADTAVAASAGTPTELVETEWERLLTQEARARSSRLTDVPAPLRPLAAEIIQFMRAHPDQVDPFWYWPTLPAWHDLRHHWTVGMARQVSFSPDAPVKGGEPGGITYLLEASTPSMDAWVESERWRLRFVPYLRHCLLEWGGFPGIGEYTDLPASMMAPLTIGLPAF